MVNRGCTVMELAAETKSVSVVSMDTSNDDHKNSVRLAHGEYELRTIMTTIYLD